MVDMRLVQLMLRMVVSESLVVVAVVQELGVEALMHLVVMVGWVLSLLLIQHK